MTTSWFWVTVWMLVVFKMHKYLGFPLRMPYILSFQVLFCTKCCTPPACLHVLLTINNVTVGLGIHPSMSQLSSFFVTSSWTPNHDVSLSAPQHKSFFHQRWSGWSRESFGFICTLCWHTGSSSNSGSVFRYTTEYSCEEFSNSLTPSSILDCITPGTSRKAYTPFDSSIDIRAFCHPWKYRDEFRNSTHRWFRWSSRWREGKGFRTPSCLQGSAYESFYRRKQLF